MFNEKSVNNTIVTRNGFWAWSASFIIYTGLFLLMLEYHRWRGRPYSLFTANKAVAIASSLLFSFSLGLGPLCRLTGSFQKAIRLRRTLGVTAAIFMVIHVLLSLFFVEKFDLTYYSQNWRSPVFGAAALIGFLLMWITSYKWALERLGQDKWKKLQTMGYLFLALNILHIIVLGKIGNWILWFKTFNKPVPPGTMIPSVIAAVVILLKLIDMVFSGKKLSK